jgi:dolichol-phosphate mannosyltransferase
MMPLHLDQTGYAFPMQLWPRVWKAGLRIKEIPVRLIYNDPNRYFGGMLDDAQHRLRHYIDVLNSELQGWACATEPAEIDSLSCCACE